jgi:hypothetical protein
VALSRLLHDARHRPGPDARAVTTVAFDVPARAAALRVELELEAAHRRTRVDATLHDPAGFRGFAMSDRGHALLAVAAAEAAPGCLRGPVGPGRWTLALRWANVEGDVGVRVRVHVDGADAADAGRVAAEPPPPPPWPEPADPLAGPAAG